MSSAAMPATSPRSTRAADPVTSHTDITARGATRRTMPHHERSMRHQTSSAGFHRHATMPLTLLLAAACTSELKPATGAEAVRSAGVAMAIRDTTFAGGIEASGVAEPMRQATLSTKLMGTVTAVLVQEGDRVTSGAPLLRIDARDLDAKAGQVAAGIADARAQLADATTQAARMRALYADSAATKAQNEAAQTGLARSEAGLRAAQASARELDAVRSYATVRAPFAGIVTSRMVDPGAFAAPGALLVTVQDVSTLRISVSASGAAARSLQRGQVLDATIDGAAVSARIEGVVPASVGNLFMVNAIVGNAGGTHTAGSTATLRLSTGAQHGLLVPQRAIVRDGDLTGVMVRGATRDERRWVRLGATVGTMVEVAGGLSAGETIVVPPATAP